MNKGGDCEAQANRFLWFPGGNLAHNYLMYFCNRICKMKGVTVEYLKKEAGGMMEI